MKSIETGKYPINKYNLINSSEVKCTGKSADRTFLRTKFVELFNRVSKFISCRAKLSILAKFKSTETNESLTHINL